MLDLNDPPKIGGNFSKNIDSSIIISHILLVINEIHWNLDEFAFSTGWVEDKGIQVLKMMEYLESKGLNIVYPKEGSNLTFSPYDLLLFNDIVAIVTYTGYDTIEKNYISIIKNINLKENSMSLIINYPSIEFPGGHLTPSLMQNPKLYFVSKKRHSFIHQFISY